ncbi:alpha/beta fold hydrolase [Pontimicrobium sp. MEBiC06410]
MNTKLLLLHGALGSKEQLKKLKNSLSSNFEVYDLDFEGHGVNKSNAAFSIDLFTDNVIQFLNEHKIECISIFGYSMGGYVALNLANKKPELVSKIVTFGTKFNWTKETAEQEAKMLNPDKIEEKVPSFANSLSNIHGFNWKTVVRKTATMMLGLGNNKILTEKVLQSIPHKILITIGDKDKMVSLEESQKSATLLPNGTLQIIENFPHQIEKIDIKNLTKIITGFITP